MIDKLKRALQDATDVLRAQASTFGEGAREKSYEVIEDWLAIFPRLEIYGLEMTSFALGVAISPSLEVEMRGKHEQFPQQRLNEIMEDCKGNAALTTVFSTIKTTYNLHNRTYGALRDPLIVKIHIRISPEIKVYLGEPIIN